MPEQSYFMGLDGFVWFVGVVEDRNDPDALGRVRVRCIGFHTEDISALPTTDLPWAHVMHPVTDPSMHGMGNSPSWLVEGSYVIGFFRDAGDKQQPIIIGSLPGIPESAADPRSGFNDPRSINTKQDAYKGDPAYGPYPVDGDKYSMKSGHGLYESDTNRLAQGRTSETHNSLINRRDQRLSGDPTFTGGSGIPTATQPNLKGVSAEPVAEDRGFFEEPHPKGHIKDRAPYISAAYPYNHVFESESGHIREIDDSPNAERLFTQHKSGTFEEIHPDGTKVVKIIGDNYEIVAGSSNVYISGDVNITTEGTVREYIKGDYILEVEGNYTQKIGRNLRTKVGYKSGGGNLEEEINGNHGYHIKGFVNGTVGPFGGATPPEGNVTLNIIGNEIHNIGKDLMLKVSDDITLNAGNDMVLFATDSIGIATASGITSIKAPTVDIRSTLTTTIQAGTSMDIDAISGIDIETLAGGIDITALIGNVDISTVAGVIELN